MIEILWHGRGGQGAFTAARLLGAAASLGEGRFALAFPSFGPERRGAPIRAFTKVADKPIGDRSAVKQADFVVYLDETLLNGAWAGELKAGGVALVNSARRYGDPRIVSVDADGISAAVLGRPIPNTAFLGALAALGDFASIEDVREAARLYLPERIRERNLVIIDEVYGQMRQKDSLQQAEAMRADGLPEDGSKDSAGCRVAGDVSSALGLSESADSLTSATALPLDKEEEGALLRTDSDESAGSDANRPSRRPASIPTLHADELRPEDFAQTTCFEAGYLVSTNAGWRNVRPVIDAEKCTGCLKCYLHCPDGTVFKCASTSSASAMPSISTRAATGDSATAAAGIAPVAVDYAFCKGCGICARMCASGAIAMVSEREALAAENAGLAHGLKETPVATAESSGGTEGRSAGNQAREAVAR